MHIKGEDKILIPKRNLNKLKMRQVLWQIINCNFVLMVLYLIFYYFIKENIQAE